jgi:predicted acyl esterase
MIVERDVFVTARDGERLAVDVFRPDGDGRYPALLAMSAYGKGKQTLPIPPLPPQSPVWDGGIEAGDPEYLTAHGYAHVIADSRGMGKSGGTYRGWMNYQEGQDGHDIIEWIAAQPWCDGNVGMVGESYFGTIQLAIAAEQPPHLKAIMPFNAPADFYREATHHGGIVQTFFYWLYYFGLGGTRRVSASELDLPPEEFAARVQATLNDPDIQAYSRHWVLVDNPDRNPGWFDILINPEDGPFYWERSAYKHYDKIKIPIYCESAWWAYGHMHLVGAFRNYLGIDAPKKLLIRDPVVYTRPMPEEYNREVVRWYDYWLKGIDTGIMAEQPIRIYIMGAEKWRDENEWPLARTEWTKYYLRGWGGLSPDPGPEHGRPDTFVQQSLIESNVIGSVSYATQPLDADVEITGPMAMYLHAAIDTDDTNWMAYLYDVAPNGTERELTRGFLKASHRRLDDEQSTPWEPYHPHTDREPVTPGQICEYAIAFAPTANVFKVGHRIKLQIRSMDLPGGSAPAALGINHLPSHLCSSRTTVHHIYHDADRPSHLLLPVIPGS